MKTLLFLMLCAAAAAAQPIPAKGLLNGAPKGYVCGRATTPVVIDGKLDDRVWKEAPWTDNFVDIEGTLKPSPMYRTKVKMLWDDSCLYIGAEIEEPHVWATLLKRDTVIFYDNDFEVFIDPNGDNHEYYEFEMNAFNTGWDLFLNIPYRDGGKANDAWDMVGLRTAVHVDGTINDPRDKDLGWTAELAIPWKALEEYAHMPCPPREGDQWRINFSRVEWDIDIVGGKYQKIKGRPEHNWVWSPQWVIDMHQPETWGTLQFTRGKAATAHLRPDSSLGARTALMTLYHAQREFKEASKRWGESLEEIGLGEMVLPKGVTDLQMHPSADGWSAEVKSGGRIWRVRSDSKFESAN
jgi:hypothetical protein